MARYWWRRSWKWILVSTLAISGAYASSGDGTKAQIQPDTTLPQNSIVTPQGSTSRIDGGTKAGSNLFHSFTQFSVPTGGTAYFNNTLDVRNIFSRVTGGGVSNIDGTLQANGTANLFLLNPNGVIFGLNAQLNIGGSFVVTTANAIGFGSQGVFSATIPNDPSLLTVEPSVFLFNQSAAQPSNSIVNQGTLQVNPGNSLLLVGGNVSPNSDMTGGILIDGTINGYLSAPGGRIEIGGLLAPGSIGLVIDQNNSGLMSLNFPKGVERADVSLANTAALDVRGNNGGSIAITARQLSVSGGSVVLAGIAPSDGFVGAKAGDITIDATSGVSVDSSSVIANQVSPGSIGDGGNISITARTLSIMNGAQLDTATLGQGNAGNVTMTTSGSINLDGQGSNGVPSTVASSVEPGAVGNGGNVDISTGVLSVTNGAQIQAGTFGQGNAGNVTITASDRIKLDGQDDNGASGVGSTVEAGSVGNGGNVEVSTSVLSITNGAEIQAATFGQGNAGNVMIAARDSIKLDEQGNNDPTAVASSVAPGAVGNGGNVDISTGNLSVTNGAQINTSTGGQGNAGNVGIAAGNGINLNASSVASAVEGGAVGNGGNIEVSTGTLSVINGAKISAATSGQGNAGNVTITARDSINLNRYSNNGASAIVSSVEGGAVGNGGNVGITASTLSVTDGAEIQAIIFGRGNAGNVTITASDRINLDGYGHDGTAIATSVEPGALGNGGKVEVNTGNLSVSRGAQIQTATFGQGNAGNVTINARDTIKLDGQGSGGASSVFSSVQPGAVGNGGDISISAPVFSITNGATVDASSYGKGNAGDIANITARTLNLDNGSIATISISGNGGNIRNLQVQDLLLLHNHSQISTTAGTQQSGGGNGGNININAGFVVAVPIEDSDIAANAFAGKGGNIQISTQGIFGFTLQASPIPLSRITASSQLGINGTVQITTPGIDPSRGLVPVPVSPGAPDVPQNCQASARQGGSRFINSQRGGLPPNPQEALSSSTLWSDSRSPRQLQNR